MSKQTQWIDISQPLDDNIAHWPGDTAFSYHLTFPKTVTGSVNIGSMTTSLHTGTHVDAPFHFRDDGERILDLDLNVFIGPARVIDVSSASKINEDALRTANLNGISRVLFKTSVPNQPECFPEQIPPITADGAAFLKEKGIVLVGVDVPSVDPLDSKEMTGHHALYEHGIHILENLMLDEIAEGDYELIALPLPLKEADGSPVRAVIRPI
ncbi:arylformamidase [Bacillus tianshenii]|nr:arylformamidase [Bacillus tianshenii]